MRYYQRLPCTNIALIPMRSQQTPENKSRRLHRSDLVCDGTNDFRILIISSCQQDIGVGIGETSFNPPMGNIPRVHQTPPIEALRNFVSSLSVVNYTLRQQLTTHTSHQTSKDQSAIQLTCQTSILSINVSSPPPSAGLKTPTATTLLSQ